MLPLRRKILILCCGVLVGVLGEEEVNEEKEVDRLPRTVSVVIVIVIVVVVVVVSIVVVS
jgi:hypothetical protein